MSDLEELVRATLREHAGDAPAADALLGAVHERLGNRGRGRPVASLIAALIVVLIVVGVAVLGTTHRGSEAPPATSPRPPAPTPTTPAPTTPPTTVARPKGSVCPHAPIRQVQNSYRGLPDPSGPSLEYRSAASPFPVSDGRGDEIRVVGLGLQIVRPDGIVKLANVIPRAWGDFDGDGRTDVVIDVQDARGDQTSYFVPGTVSPGVRDPATVGLRLPPVPAAGYISEFFFSTWTAVGDQNHDGADDLIGNNRLYSGRKMTVGKPGGALAALPAPLRTLPHPPVGILQLATSGPPVFVEADVSHSALVVEDNHSDRLTISNAGLRTAMVNGGHVTGWLVGSQHVVQYSFGTRAGTTAWRWDLDAPCTR